jgi:hypothetical protein
MSPLPVIKHLDVFAYSALCLCTSPEVPMVNQRRFQASPRAFHRCVVEALPVHRLQPIPAAGAVDRRFPDCAGERHESQSSAAHPRELAPKAHERASRSIHCAKPPTHGSASRSRLQKTRGAGSCAPGTDPANHVCRRHGFRNEIALADVTSQLR